MLLSFGERLAANANRPLASTVCHPGPCPSHPLILTYLRLFLSTMSHSLPGASNLNPSESDRSSSQLDPDVAAIRALGEHVLVRRL